MSETAATCPECGGPVRAVCTVGPGGFIGMAHYEPLPTPTPDPLTALERAVVEAALPFIQRSVGEGERYLNLAFAVDRLLAARAAAGREELSE